MQNNIDQLIKLIDEKVDIVKIINDYVSLEKKGNNFVGLCPFHSDNSPSMSVSPAKKIFKCFSCGAGGSAITFVKNFEGISFIDSLKLISEKININWREYINEKKIVFDKKILRAWEINKEAFNYFSYNLIQNKISIDYLKKRNIDDEKIKIFKIGYSPLGDGLVKFLLKKSFSSKEILDYGLAIEKESKLYDYFQDRIIFSIQDINENIIGFSGRIISNNSKYSKYLNSPETILFKKNSILYNISNAKKNLLIKKDIIVLEGFMDVISLYGEGIKNVIATMGTAFTDEHIKQIEKLTKNIVLSFDSDVAGINATIASAKKLLNFNIKPSVIKFDLSFAKDFDELIKNNKNKLNEILNNKQEFIFYYKNIIFEIMDKNKSDISFKPIRSLLKILIKYNDNLLNDRIFSEINEKYNVSKEIIQDEYIKINQEKEKNFNQKINQKNVFNNEQKIIFELEKKIIEYLSKNIDLINEIDFSFISGINNETNNWFQKLKISYKEKTKLDLITFEEIENSVYEKIKNKKDFNQILQNLIMKIKEYRKKQLLEEVKKETDIERVIKINELLKKIK